MAAARARKPSRSKKGTARTRNTFSWKRLVLIFSLWITALGLTTLGLVGALLVPQNTIQERPNQKQQAALDTSISQPRPKAYGQDKSSPPEKPRTYEQIPQEAPKPALKPVPESELDPAPEHKAPQEKQKPLSGPCLAVVIDDMGQSLSKARRLLRILGTDLTWSILPFCAKTPEVVQLAAEHDLEYLLHVPMEPKRYPRVDSGPGSILVGMSPEQILAILDNNLDQVPGAVGANNHMGSRFTEDLDGMQVVLEEIKSRHLFFMDSLTSPESKVRDIAKDLRMPVAFRDVFLDNRQDVQAIVSQLRKAERVALRSGKAVAIGHPYPETLTALDKWSKERDTDVQLVKLSRVIDSQ